MAQPDMTETTRLQQLYTRRVAARGDGGGESCVSPEAILAVVRREGPEEERLATLEHVMSCAACHREYEWLTAVDQAALEAERGTGAARRPWWRGAPLALAASLVAVVGAGLLVRGVLRNGAEPVRGAPGDIVLVAPAAGAAPGPLTFVWRPVPGAWRYVLEVQRFDGSVAFADTTADTTVTLTEPRRVLPGSAYRWRVREATGGAEPPSSVLRPLLLPGR